MGIRFNLVFIIKHEHFLYLLGNDDYVLVQDFVYLKVELVEIGLIH